jgi:hypothetical protein
VGQKENVELKKKLLEEETKRKLLEDELSVEKDFSNKPSLNVVDEITGRRPKR